MLKKNIVDLILSNINDSEIFRHYFGKFEIGSCYSSVFRTDSNPSTSFYVNNNGKIIYHDFTTGEKLTAISFVMKLYDIPFVKAIKLIGSDLEIINNDNSLNTLRKKFDKKVTVDKPKTDLYIISRDFTGRDISYFESYNIKRDDLIKNDVFSVQSMLLNGKFINTFDEEVRVAYRLLDTDDTYFKVYSPNSKKFKWLSTVPLSKPFGLDSLSDGKMLIITKSLKDKMVLNKFFDNVIALQNESPSSLPDDLALMLKDRYEQVYINFDCDSPGKRASEYYEQTYNFLPLRLPDKAYKEYKLKDYSDFIKHFGYEKLKELIRWQKI